VNILIIGYGSIGKRHEEVISIIDSSNVVHLVTKQTIPGKVTYKSISDIEDLNIYDYFIIASETYKHFEQLSYLDSRVSGKKIFCEKPLFEKYEILKNISNTIVVGYVLRFHPLLQKLKNKIRDERVLMANIQCGQYLPGWRKDIDYRDSYSSKKEEGGGVLLDLSHEIDYCQWLFGTIIEIKSYQRKISDLEINSDDVVVAIGKTEQEVIINLSIDYISKITHRRMIVETLENTFELDFINNILKQKDKTGEEQIFNVKGFERNELFVNMHTAILADGEIACSFSEGLDVMKTIQVIQEQNL
jgi:CMP-N,N'-diacetyllegionaminic acid synthase